MGPSVTDPSGGGVRGRERFHVQPNRNKFRRISQHPTPLSLSLRSLLSRSRSRLCLDRCLRPQSDFWHGSSQHQTLSRDESVRKRYKGTTANYNTTVVYLLSGTELSSSTHSSTIHSLYSVILVSVQVRIIPLKHLLYVRSIRIAYSS